MNQIQNIPIGWICSVYDNIVTHLFDDNRVVRIKFASINMFVYSNLFNKGFTQRRVKQYLVSIQERFLYEERAFQS